MQSAKCVENGYFDWEPYTNYDRIMDMTIDEMAEWMMQDKSPVGEVTGLACRHCYTGCWHESIVIPTKELVVNWLNNRVEIDDESK